MVRYIKFMKTQSSMSTFLTLYLDFELAVCQEKEKSLGVFSQMINAILHHKFQIPPTKS